MLIRVVTTRGPLPRTGEGIAFVHGEIEPRISAMHGNEGFTMAVDHASGRYLGIAAWSDAEAMEAGGGDASRLIADLARHVHGSEPAVEVFELALAHVVKPVRVGYWGRVMRFEVPVRDLARAVRRATELALALFARYDERYTGLAAVDVSVDRTSGVLGNLVWYDSLRVLRADAARADELRELLVADVPTARVVDRFELQVVIAEVPHLPAAQGPGSRTW